MYLGDPSNTKTTNSPTPFNGASPEVPLQGTLYSTWPAQSEPKIQLRLFGPRSCVMKRSSVRPQLVSHQKELSTLTELNYS